MPIEFEDEFVIQNDNENIRFTQEEEGSQGNEEQIEVEDQEIQETEETQVTEQIMRDPKKEAKELKENFFSLTMLLCPRCEQKLQAAIMDCLSVITGLSLDKVCRVCLEENEDMFSIFSKIAADDNFQDSSYIFEILMNISNMKLESESNLPNLICNRCLDLAQVSFSFREKCNQSQTILDEYYNQLSIQTFDSKLSSVELLIEDEAILTPPEDIDNGKDSLTEDIELENFVEQENDIDEDGIVEEEIVRNEEIEESLDCEGDNKLSKTTDNLKSHNSNGPGPYVCKICGKQYRQSGTLTAHMRIHTGHRPFLCSICGKGFRQAPDLKYHMRTHTKEKPYMCNVCGKTMTMQCHLVQHMRIHTGERPYKCDNCNKAFPSSTRLKRHAITHTDLKPYTCEVCNKSFNRASSLRVHEKIHRDEKSHVCPICGKRFIQGHTLRSHVLTHSTATIN